MNAEAELKPFDIPIEPEGEHAERAAAHRADQRFIRVRGAREHNLKNIDVSIPRDKLVVMTGLSGSGKSSLAFDTIFAEGQRKYMESLSAYARQFLEQLKKPDVDEVEGIPPTIAIEQRSASGNPRSTVATTTEIYDYLRLLFARCGTPYSWAPTKTKKDGTVLARSGRPISAATSTQIVDAVMAWEREAAKTGVSGSASEPRIMVLAPVVRGKKGFHRDVLEELQQAGWSRARVNGMLVDLREVLKDPGENPLKLGRYEKHDLDAVIDRLTLKATPETRQRLAESVEAALKLAQGSVVISRESAAAGSEVAAATPHEAEPVAEGKKRKNGGKSSAKPATSKSASAWIDHPFSTNFADPEHPEISLAELSPRLFSFNSPFGACPQCNGLGTILEMDEDLIIPDATLPLGEGAIACWSKNGHWKGWFNRQLRKFCKDFGASMATPANRLTKEQRRILLHGTTPDDAATFGKAKWKGVIPDTMRWWQTTETENVKEFLSQFLSQKACPGCLGDRLKVEALHVMVESAHKADTKKAFSESVIGRPRGDGTMLNIAELSRLTINDAIAFAHGLKLSKEQRTIAEPILKEVNNRLRFLTSVGLEYLSLDRKTATLSGGEAQRIRLATQVGSGLVGAAYVLDEPTIGLHQRDNTRLISTLRHLADIGNTVLVVEHDEEMIRAADHVLDIGPGPGVHGGRVVAQGTVEQIIDTKGSITGDYLAGRKYIAVPKRRRSLGVKHAITVKGARENNLKGVDIAIPLGGLVCVTGVSGSGKSTLVNDIVLRAVKQALLGSKERPGQHDSIKGLDAIDRIIEVDQTPIGRTPRSNPATYTGIFDDIRRVFAQVKESKIRGYEPGRFSFNVPAQRGGGRCEACQGQGVKKIEMHFLPDVYVQCEVCEGRRYNRETLEIKYRGKSIADVLDMTVEAAVGFFENHPLIHRFARCLHDVGLDYITLGQQSTTLSGGEAQRVKLATELGKAGGTKNMPTVDEFGNTLKPAPARTNRDEEPESAQNLEIEEPETGAAAGPKRRSAAMRSSPYGHTLYVLDEPTTGLHFEDIRKLVEVFDRLADGGATTQETGERGQNTLLVIEHNLDVIKRADWIIDLGPEGGDGGGRIIAQGPPEAIAKIDTSHTGKYLKQVLG
jgi:excinuclease ABC subunit A